MRLAKWATSTATSSSSSLLTEAMKDSGLSAFHTAIPNTDSRGTTEFSDAEADITRAAGSSSGRYTGEEVRRVIASCCGDPQPPRPHIEKVLSRATSRMGVHLPTGLDRPCPLGTNTRRFCL